jgi:hypothetical protein
MKNTIILIAIILTSLSGYAQTDANWFTGLIIKGKYVILINQN